LIHIWLLFTVPVISTICGPWLSSVFTSHLQFLVTLKSSTLFLPQNIISPCSSVWVKLISSWKHTKFHHARCCARRTESTHTHSVYCSLLTGSPPSSSKAITRSLLPLTQVWALQIYMAWREDIPGFGLYHWAALLYDEILHPLFRECAICRLQCPQVGHVSSKYKLLLRIQFLQHVTAQKTWIVNNIDMSIICFHLGNSPASEFYMPKFRNTLSVPSS